MTRTLASALFAILAGALAVHAMPRELVARSATVQPSFDIAMPAAQEPSAVALIASSARTGTSLDK